MEPSRKQSLQKTVVRLLQENKRRHANRLVKKEMTSLPDGAPRNKRAALLDLLLTIELDAGRDRAALGVLSRLRELGYRNRDKVMFHSLLAAKLLMRTQQWFTARAELTELLMKRTELFDSLETLVSYVECDEKCREIMRYPIEATLNSAVKHFGIPVQIRNHRGGIEKAIRQAYQLGRIANKKYSLLMLEAFEGQTKERRDALLQDLKKYIETEPVGYYRKLAQGLRRQLTTRRKKSVTSR